MVHLTDADLIARLDGETQGGRGDRTGVHLGACPVCRARLAKLDATLVECAGALRQLDAAEPARWTDDRDLRRPLAGGVDVLRPGTGRQASRHGTWRWAAVLMLLLAGAAASGAMLIHYLAPAAREPAPGAQQDLVEWSAPDAATVMVRPSQDTVRITIIGAGPAPSVDAAKHTRPDVSVTIIGAVAPRFAARDGSITVTIAEPGALVQVRFPATVQRGLVVADGVEVVRVVEGTIVPPR